MIKPKYTKLRIILVATIIFFSLAPMLIVGIGIPFQFSDLYYKKTLREVGNVAKAKGKTIDVFMEERIALLKTIADTTSYDQLTQEGYLSTVLGAVKKNSQSYVDLGIIDMEGNHKAYAGPYQLGDANYKDEAWFKETIRRNVFVSDVFLGFRNFPHIIIAVLRVEGGKSWILRATIDSEIFSSIVHDGQMSKSGDSFVISRGGQIQTQSALAGGLMDKVNLTWPRHESEKISEESLGGKDMLVAKVPLDYAPWLLVVAENPAEHLSSLYSARLMSAGLMIAGLLALCLGTWFITARIVKHLEEADDQKAHYDAVIMQASKMAALGKMAAGIAHEINNPLMLIREYAGWVKDLLHDEDKEKMESYDDMESSLGKIEQNVDRAKDVTHRLLGFARRVDPVPESIPLTPIIEQAVAFLNNEAERRKVVIEKDFSVESIRVATDVGQLQQVVLNIVDNAIDAVEDGGLVYITTIKMDDTACIEVRDTGSGIDEEDLKQIFDPFFTTKKQGDGTGLGLSICYSIMESLGGTISVKNHPEGGAVFSITLPVSTAEA